MKNLTVADIREKQSDIYPSSIDAKVQSLDLKNLSEADLMWLHDLKNLAQHINNAMYKKEMGLPSTVKGGR